jgi:hypothetical protein
MKKKKFVVFVLFVCAGFALFAQSKLDGIWEGSVDGDKAMLVFTKGIMVGIVNDSFEVGGYFGDDGDGTLITKEGDAQYSVTGNNLVIGPDELNFMRINEASIKKAPFDGTWYEQSQKQKFIFYKNIAICIDAHNNVDTAFKFSFSNDILTFMNFNDEIEETYKYKLDNGKLLLSDKWDERIFIRK